MKTREEMLEQIVNGSCAGIACTSECPIGNKCHRGIQLPHDSSRLPTRIVNIARRELYEKQTDKQIEEFLRGEGE